MGIVSDMIKKGMDWTKDKLFGKERKITGPYAEVKWKRVAKKRCVGGDIMKQIVVKDKHGGILETREFSETEIESLERSGFPVTGKEIKNKSLPDECRKKPDVVRKLGQVSK